MNKYNEEFKTSAIKLALSSDQSYSKTAKELGVHPKTFYNWLRPHIPTNEPKEDMETITLRKELHRTKQELEILKKAAAYFAKNLK